MVMDKLWPLLTGLGVLLAGALALQAYAVRRGNETIRIVIQDESGAGGGDEDGGEAAPAAEGDEGPARSEAHAKARLLARRAEFDQALPLFEQEATARPDDAGLAAEYGAWLAAAGQPERALAWLVKADQLRPGAQSALALGELRARLGDRAGAEADLRRVIALRPTSNPARVTLGELLLKKGERAEAVALLEGASTTGSNEERAHALVTLGGAYLLAGRRAEADKAFDKAILYAPARPDVRLGIARAWLAMDSKEDVRRALPILARTVEIAPDVPAVFAAVGRARERLGEDAAATEAYDRALRLDPSFRYARRRLLRLALGNRDFARARREAERLVADAPGVPEHHFLMALVAERDGRRDDARKAYRAAIEAAKGDYPEAYLNLGVLERNADDFAAARQAYDKALELRPRYPAAWLDIGKLLEAQGKPAEAEEAYRKALAIEPRHANGQLYLGQLLADLKRWDEAERALRASLEAKPGNVAAQLSLGVVYARSGRLDQAVATYRRVLDANPRLVPALHDLALALEQQGKVAEARQALQQALEADPGHVGSLRELAQLELGARRLPEARRAWQDLLDAAPGDVPARAALAELSALEGDRRACESAARALQREAPDDGAVRALAGRCAAVVSASTTARATP
jgi:tetratricopeptide (TPR) repeat protein